MRISDWSSDVCSSDLGIVDAAWLTQRHSRREGRGGGPDRRHEPLPQDRVRPPAWRALLGRLQLAHHFEQTPEAGGTMTGEIMDHPRQPGFETRAVHAGAPPDPMTGARNVPIYHSPAYVFADVEHAASLFDLSTFGYISSRPPNPTVAALK